MLILCTFPGNVTVADSNQMHFKFIILTCCQLILESFGKENVLILV